MHIPNFIFGDPCVCTYCGERAIEIDHVIPVSSYINRNRKGVDDSKGIRTYACFNCNRKLGAKKFPNFNSRLLFVKKLYQEKSKAYKRKASWSDKEIAALDHTLRTYVANKQVEMRKLDSRVTWIDSIEFRVVIRNLSHANALDKLHPSYCEWVYTYFSGYA